jgi:hypothetical protein
LDSDFKALKINNAAWLPQIGEHIETFCRKINVDGIYAPNLYAFFAQTIQFGNNLSEFWVTFDKENKPQAFGHWTVLGLPHIATVYMGYVHSWEKDKMAARILLDEYIKFGEKHNAVWYSYNPITKAAFRYLESVLEKKGFTIKDTGIINAIARRKS